jgi:hypothetical protein
LRIENIYHADHQQIVRVPANRELRIQLPEAFQADQESEVIVSLRSEKTALEEKAAAIRQAMDDPAFLADLTEVAADFDSVDGEGWVS